MLSRHALRPPSRPATASEHRTARPCRAAITSPIGRDHGWGSVGVKDGVSQRRAAWHLRIFGHTGSHWLLLPSSTQVALKASPAPSSYCESSTPVGGGHLRRTSAARSPRSPCLPLTGRRWQRQMGRLILGHDVQAEYRPLAAAGRQPSASAPAQPVGCPVERPLPPLACPRAPLPLCSLFSRFRPRSQEKALSRQDVVDPAACA